MDEVRDEAWGGLTRSECFAVVERARDEKRRAENDVLFRLQVSGWVLFEARYSDS